MAHDAHEASPPFPLRRLLPIPLCDLCDLCAMLFRFSVISHPARDVPARKFADQSDPPSVTSVTSVRCFSVFA
jgi:hypothetical protein